MAAEKVLTLVSGTRPAIRVRFRKKVGTTWVPLDLTDANDSGAIEFYLKRVGPGAPAMVVNGSTMTREDVTGGVAYYFCGANDLDTPGNYKVWAIANLATATPAEDFPSEVVDAIIEDRTDVT